MPCLGPSLPIFRSGWRSLPPASSRGWACPQLASFSLVLAQSFALRVAEQCLRLGLFNRIVLSFFFPLSLLLSHSLSCYLTLAPPIALRAFRPSPYPKQCHQLLSVSPRLSVADVSVWGAILLGVAFRHVICGVYLFIFPPSYVALCDSKTSPRPTGERVSWFLDTSPLLRLPSQGRSPSQTLLSLFLSFIFCPTSFQRQWAAFLGGLCPLPAFRSCFVGLLSVQMFFQ